MNDAEFQYIRDFLYRRMGLTLDDGKRYLVRSRLSRLAREHKVGDANELARRVRRDEHGEIAQRVMDAMTTNETLFFRDGWPFEALRERIFPELDRTRGRQAQVRVWSAAASTGQEAWSIAMTAREHPGMGDRLRIYGSDLSDKAIERARAAEYSDMEVKRGLPQAMRDRWFVKVGARWRVRESLRAMATFETGNLFDDALVTRARRHGPFDIVFCRNVLIYFDPEDRKGVIDRIARCMRPGGWLLTGATERPEGRRSQWTMETHRGKRLWRLDA